MNIDGVYNNRFIYTVKKDSGRLVIVDKENSIIIRDMYRACDFLNKLDKENKKLKQSNKWLRANRKDCEKGRIRERKSFNKSDEMRVEHIRFLQKRLKENGLSIYMNE